MADTETVYVLKDEQDRTWDFWEVRHENGRQLGTADTLAQIRRIYDTRLHNGGIRLPANFQEHEPAKWIPTDWIAPGKWRVYWFEREKNYVT